MIKGTYIFYIDGKEVKRSDNVITKFGKRFLTNFIAGRVSFNTKSLAIGIDETAETENDTRLGFEFYRVPVEFGSTDITTVDSVSSYSVVYKATLPQNISGNIYEIGLYPDRPLTLNNYDSKFLAGFDNQLDWIDADGYSPDSSTENSNIGENLLVLTSGIDSANEYITSITNLDLSGYSVNDTIRFAYYKYDENLDSIKIKFYSSTSDYYSTSIAAASGTGYKITSDISFADILNSPTGTPNISDISKIGIEVTPVSGEQSSVGADGLRINDEDTFNPDFGLVSRSTLDAPLQKLAGRQVDIEYRLDITF